MSRRFGAMFAALALWGVCSWQAAPVRAASVFNPAETSSATPFYPPETNNGSVLTLMEDANFAQGDGTAGPQWTIVHAGQALTLRAGAQKSAPAHPLDALLLYERSGFTSVVNRYSTAEAVPPWAPALSLRNQTPILPVGIDYPNMRFSLVAPQVSAPTWYTFQLQPWARIVNSDGKESFYWNTTSRANLLVLPQDYHPTLSVPQAVLFARQSVSVNIPGLTVAIVPDYPTGADPLVTVAQSTRAPYAATVTADGRVGTTQLSGHLVFAPMYDGEPPVIVDTPAIPIYTGNLANQTVYRGQNATFHIELPQGLSATNVRWTVGGVAQSGTGDSLVVPTDELGSRQNVTAVLDVQRGGQPIATNVATNTATLSVLTPAAATMSFDKPLLFAATGPSSPLGRSDTLKASILSRPATASAITWRAVVPGTTKPSDKATVAADGTVVAVASGTVDILGEYVAASGVLYQARRTLTVVTLADVTVVAGTAPTLALPAFGSLTAVSAAWYLPDADGAWPATPSATTGGDDVLPAVTSAEDGRDFQAVVTLRDGNGIRTTLTSNVATLHVLPPPGLALQAVPSFEFGTQSVQALTAGVSGLVATGTPPRLLVVSDNRGASGGWQLSVALDRFATAQARPGLAGSLAMALSGVAAPKMPPLAAGGAAATVSSTQQVAVWQASGTLSLPPTAAPVAGDYTAALHWTLAAVPQATAP